MKAKICERCGNEYTPTGYCQKVCASCKHLNDIERMRKYREEHKVPGPGSGGNQLGEKNNMWKGGTSKFRDVKLASMNGEYFCERCNKDLRKYIGTGVKNGMWGVHHKDHNRENPALENLELLCKRCHQKEHKCWLNYLKS